MGIKQNSLNSKGPQMDLKIKIEELKKGYVLVILAGDMDAYSSEQFKAVVGGLIKRKKYKLIVDIEKVTCIDSVGVGKLLNALKRTREKEGNLWLIYNKSKVKRFFEITELYKNFTVFKDRRQARKELLMFEYTMEQTYCHSCVSKSPGNTDEMAGFPLSRE